MRLSFVEMECARVVLAARRDLCAGTRPKPPRHGPPRGPKLTIHSGAESFPSNPILIRVSRSLAASPSPIDYYAECLESVFPGEERCWHSGLADGSIKAHDNWYRDDRYELRFVLDHRGVVRAIIFFGSGAGRDHPAASATHHGNQNRLPTPRR